MHASACRSSGPVELVRPTSVATLAGVPLAEIYPLVTARALARPFTYEVADETS